jgi:hypothetical protein
MRLLTSDFVSPTIVPGILITRRKLCRTLFVTLDSPYGPFTRYSSTYLHSTPTARWVPSLCTPTDRTPHHSSLCRSGSNFTVSPVLTEIPKRFPKPIHDPLVTTARTRLAWATPLDTCDSVIEIVSKPCIKRVFIRAADKRADTSERKVT